MSSAMHDLNATNHPEATRTCRVCGEAKPPAKFPKYILRTTGETRRARKCWACHHIDQKHGMIAVGINGVTFRIYPWGQGGGIDQAIHAMLDDLAAIRTGATLETVARRRGVTRVTLSRLAHALGWRPGKGHGAGRVGKRHVAQLDPS